MTPKQYQLAGELFLQVRELDKPQRCAVLRQACEDEPEVRARVEAMLQQDLRTDVSSRPEILVGREMLDEQTLRLRGLARASSSSSWELQLPSKVAIAGFDIKDRLGEGGMGVVWRAVQLSTHREVALKQLSFAAFGSERSRARFEREVELAARLQHPNIARVYDSGVADGVPFYAMELIDGVALDEYVDSANMPETDILSLFHTICLAIQHAHGRGIIHRDLKPSNILVTADGKPYIVDFGLAKTVFDSGGADVSLAGQVIGTPGYMSPEQCTGAELDTRTDVYSLGVLMYRLLTGHAPHNMEGPDLVVMRRIAENEVRRPRDVKSKLDAELEAVLLKSLALDREARYHTAGELAADIANYLGGDPLTARKASALYYLRKRLNKYKAWVMSTTVVLTMFVALLGFYIQSIRTEQARTAHKNVQFLWENRKYLKAEKEARLKAQAEQQARRQANRQAALMAWKRAREARGDGEVNASLLWLGRALELVPENEPKLSRVVRTDLTDTLRRRVRCRASLKHFHAVQAVAYSPDGKLVATGSFGHRACVWNARTGERIGRPFQHEKPVHAVAFSPDSKILVTASQDSTARLWRIAGGKQIGKALQHEQTVWRIAFSPDGGTLATASFDGTVRLWDPATGAPLRAPLKHFGPVRALAFNSDGSMLMTAAWVDVTSNRTGQRRVIGEVRIWDPVTGEERKKIPVFSPIMAAVLSQDDRYLLVGCTNGYAIVWNLETDQVLSEPPCMHRSSVQAVAFHPNNKAFVTAGVDGKAQLWRIDENHRVPAKRVMPVGRPMQHGHMIFGVAISPDGQVLATVGNGLDTHVRLWDALTAKPFSEPLTHHGPRGGGATAVAVFSPDSRSLLTGSDDGSACLWDIPRFHDMVHSKRLPKDVEHSAFSPNGKLAVTAYQDGTAQLWNVRTGQPIGQEMNCGESINRMYFSQNGKTVHFHCGPRGQEYWLRSWNTATGQPLGRHPIRASNMGAAWRPDGQVVALIRGGPSRLLVYNRHTGKVVLRKENVRQAHFTAGGKTAFLRSRFGVQRISLPTARATNDEIRLANGTLCFSRDGRRMVALTNNKKTIALWDTTTGQTLGSQITTAKMVSKMLFSPEGRVLATEGTGKLCLWDATTGQKRGPDFRFTVGDNRHVKPTGILDFAFTSDGSRLIVAGHVEQTVYVQHIITATGELAGRSFRLGRLDTEIATFSPDAKWLAYCSHSRVRIFDVATGRRISKVQHPRPVVWVRCVFSPDGKWFITRSDNSRQVCLWDTRTGKQLGRPMEHEAETSRAAFSADGQMLITWTLAGRLQRWQLPATTAVGEPLTDAGTMANSLTLHGDYAVAIGSTYRIELIDTQTGQRRRTLRPRAHINEIAFSPDGKILAAHGRYTIQMWNTETGKPCFPIQHTRETVQQLVFHPDGKSFFAGLQHQVQRRHLATGLTIGKPFHPLGNKANVVCDPAGRRLLIITNKEIRLWDAAQGEPVGSPLRVSDTTQTKGIFSPDGRQFLLSSPEGDQLHDAGTALPLGTLRPFKHPGRRTVFSRDGQFVHVISANTLHTWNIPGALSGTVAGIRRSLQILTGRELDAHGGVAPLADATR